MIYEDLTVKFFWFIGFYNKKELCEVTMCDKTFWFIIYLNNMNNKINKEYHLTNIYGF